MSKEELVFLMLWLQSKQLGLLIFTENQNKDAERLCEKFLDFNLLMGEEREYCINDLECKLREFINKLDLKI